MERRLFRVTMRTRGGYLSDTQYYVLAKDFNQAALKAKEAFIHEQETKSLLTEDGSLNKEDLGAVKISNIEFITENVLL